MPGRASYLAAIVEDNVYIHVRGGAMAKPMGRKKWWGSEEDAKDRQMKRIDLLSPLSEFEYRLEAQKPITPLIPTPLLATRMNESHFST
jgi:hypothetical protein